jgi:hypothetical protein
VTEDAGRPEPRPRPRYGEYATPEEVAAARGPLAEREPAPGPSASATGPAGRAAPQPRGGGAAASARPRSANNLITVLLLVVGVWNTATSIPSYLDLGPALAQGLELAGYGSVSFGPIAHTAGIVLLVVSVLILLAAIGTSVSLMRRGRRTVWVPLVAALLFFVATIVVMTVVVANTPALADVLHNH